VRWKNNLIIQTNCQQGFFGLETNPGELCRCY